MHTKQTLFNYEKKINIETDIPCAMNIDNFVQYGASPSRFLGKEIVRL